MMLSCKLSILLLLFIVFIIFNNNPCSSLQNQYHGQNKATSSITNININWISPTIKINNVSYEYPISIFRKLTSSEPRRQYAIQNITLTFDCGRIWMLLGSSSSGKSTLFKLIKEEGLTKTTTTTTTTTEGARISGSIDINYFYDEHNEDNNNNDIPIKKTAAAAAIPIILDGKPVYSNQQTIRSIWSKAIIKTRKDCIDEDDNLITSTILDDLEEIIFDLKTSSILDQTVGSLSPSELYKCRLGEATIESSSIQSSSLSSMMMMLNKEDTSKNDLCISSPILLLDEWLDKETSTIVHNVQNCLQRLAAPQDRGGVGAIIVTVTHKPNLYEINNEKALSTSTGATENNNMNLIRQVTLNRGNILSIT